MTQLSVADVLDRAADLIEPEGNWTQGEFARTRIGTAVFGENSQAVCWCMLGAIQHVTTDQLTRSIAHDRLRYIVGDVPNWNDDPHTTQSEVITKLREAAALARKQAVRS